MLLGAGESGKSTFLKQMRIIHGIKFEPELMREYQHVIYQNIVRGMQVLVDAREKLDIPWENQTTEYAAEQTRKFHHGNDLDAENFHQYATTLQILWRDHGIRRAYERRREFQIVCIPHSFQLNFKSHLILIFILIPFFLFIAE